MIEIIPGESEITLSGHRFLFYVFMYVGLYIYDLFLSHLFFYLSFVHSFIHFYHTDKFRTSIDLGIAHESGSRSFHLAKEPIPVTSKYYT
jgi:hypothetical protein